MSGSIDCQAGITLIYKTCLKLTKMRISLNLGTFFQDHRSVARLFISEEFKTIKDVKNRIKKVFKIDNFYLTCDNHYLPASEDVGILHNDDTVWVKLKNVPKHEKVVENNAIKTNYVSIPEENRPKKRSKKAHLTEENESDSNKEVYKVKRKKDYVEEKVKKILLKKSENDNNYVKPNLEENVKKNKKTVITFGPEESSTSENEDDSKVKKISIPKKRKLDKLKILNGDESKKIANFIPPDRLGQVNIVKTIIISNNRTNSEELNSENTAKNQSSAQITENGCKTEDLSNTMEQEENNVQENSLFSDTSFCENKRKRKRVRKRKPKITEVEVQDFNVPKDPVKPLHFNTEAKLKPKHIKFGEIAENSPIPLIENQNNSEVAISTENFKSETAETINRTLENTVSESVDLVNGTIGEINDEFITKQPLMLNSLPKIGDIIAFKIFRLSENYCPQISSYVVGKVLNYNVASGIVSFYIHCGLDQCAEPQGKFCLTSNEEEKPTNEIEFKWSELLVPKLLYP